MTQEIIEKAARNNSMWCDAVCSTHSGSGEFHKTHWLNRFGAPRYYPDLVTLTGIRDAPVQVEAISELAAASARDSLSVKDSFHCLDLHEIGFEPLFDATWLSAPSAGSGALNGSDDLQWAKVTSAADLVRWEQAWAHINSDTEASGTFRPALLSRPEIHILSALRDGVIVGGGILSSGAGVTGLSNLFALGIDPEMVWRGLSRAANASFPGLQLVAYDHGSALTAAYSAGFAPIGPLRIWCLG